MNDQTKTYAILGVVAIIVTIAVAYRSSYQQTRGFGRLVPSGPSTDIAALQSAERVAFQESKTTAFTSVLDYALNERALRSADYQAMMSEKTARKQSRFEYLGRVRELDIAERLGLRGFDVQSEAQRLQAAGEKRQSIFGFITDLFAPFAALFP